MNLDDEVKAVAERYARRDVGDLYDMRRPEVWQSVQERERALLALLRRHVARPLSSLEVLEVGCGTGDNLLGLMRLGFEPARLVGSELLTERAMQARRRLPAVLAVHEGDALALPYGAGRFDLVLQFTVFSSLLDDAFQQRLAERMWRWVRPGGAVLWYDFAFDNPRNPDVRGVPMARVRQLFPESVIDMRRVTLAPPLARAVVRAHPAAWRLFNAVPLLRTHRLAWLAKAPAG